MAAKSKNKSTPTKQEDLRPVDIYLTQYTQSNQNPVNRVIQLVTIPLIVVSLFGLLWAVPFPHLQFLGSYNGYFNWASFFIAFAVYFYSRLSPMLSYITLIILLGFSYGVIQLQGWQKAGGPALWLVSLCIFILSLGSQFAGNKIEGKQIAYQTAVKNLLISPLWALHLILKRFSIRY